MKPTGRLLVVEIVPPEGDAPHPGRLLDMITLTIPGGQEGTEPEEALLAQAGFSLNQVVTTESALGVVEATQRQQRLARNTLSGDEPATAPSGGDPEIGFVLAAAFENVSRLDPAGRAFVTSGPRRHGTGRWLPTARRSKGSTTRRRDVNAIGRMTRRE